MRPLSWHGDEEGRLGVPACPDCLRKMMAPGIIEACASVGIEYGKSTGQMIREFIDAYHDKGHKEDL